MYMDFETKAHTKEVNAKQKLAGKLMKYEGWEMLDVSQEFSDGMSLQDRDIFYRTWLKAAKVKQIEKGFLPAEDPVYP